MIYNFISKFSKNISNEIVRIQNFASAPPPKLTAQSVGKKRFRMPVETDPKKLVKFCCGANYFKEGDEIKINEDSEYPSWLWELPLKPPRLHELDPNTKEYWQKAEIVGRQREWKLRSKIKQKTMILDEVRIKNLELKYRRRFRALAKYHYNAGYDVVEHHERVDIWNTHLKDQYFLPDDPRPFYPGIDHVELPNKISNKSFFNKNLVKVGRFGL